MMTKLKISILLLSLFALYLISCANSYRKDPEISRNSILEFNIRTQTKDYQAALELVTMEEVKLLTNEDGTIKEEYLPGFKSFNISKKQQDELMVDSKDKLVGIYELILITIDQKQVSEEQKKITLTEKDSIETSNKEIVEHRSYNPFTGETFETLQEVE